MNLSHLYFGLSVLSTSAANVRTPWFYVELVCLSAWALWFLRSRRISTVLWIGLILWAGVVGYVGQAGLHALQGVLERKATDWFAGYLRGDADPYRATTSIGDVGDLKGSGRILFRVSTDRPLSPPLLLREAAYNVYKSSEWFATGAGFLPVSLERDGTTWKLRPGPEGRGHISVSASLTKGRGMLTLPTGAEEIAGLPVLSMVRNRFGAVRVEEGPGRIRYRVRFDAHASADSPPGKEDLIVPAAEKSVMDLIAERLKLKSMSPQKIFATVSAFFQRDFTYSLTLKACEGAGPSLADFLLRTRSGHCEYFASSTVLLLRSAGLPARYATGYSVNEYSPWEQQYVVRSRHAHAWALVWLDGAWRDFDTTPSSWMAFEDQGTSFLEPLRDLWSWAGYRLADWHRQERKTQVLRHAVWLLVPFIVLLYIRIRRRTRRSGAAAPGQTTRDQAPVTPGTDSEFYQVEKRLAEMGHVRDQGETLSDWIRRLRREHPSLLPDEGPEALLALHYRYRFDPEGISGEDRDALRDHAQSWLLGQHS
jgi:hypothetical protein